MTDNPLDDTHNTSITKRTNTNLKWKFWMLISLGDNILKHNNRPPWKKKKKSSTKIWTWVWPDEERKPLETSKTFTSIRRLVTRWVGFGLESDVQGSTSVSRKGIVWPCRHNVLTIVFNKTKTEHWTFPRGSGQLHVASWRPLGVCHFSWFNVFWKCFLIYYEKSYLLNLKVFLLYLVSNLIDFLNEVFGSVFLSKTI